MGALESQRNKYTSSSATRASFSFVLNLTGYVMLFYLKDRLKIRMKSSKAWKIKTQRLHCALNVGSLKLHITIAPDFHVAEAPDPEGVCPSEDT